MIALQLLMFFNVAKKNIFKIYQDWNLKQSLFSYTDIAKVLIQTSSCAIPTILSWCHNKTNKIFYEKFANIFVSYLNLKLTVYCI